MKYANMNKEQAEQFNNKFGSGYIEDYEIKIYNGKLFNWQLYFYKQLQR